jgi:peptide/nickel transport system ATP-binding protein
MRLEAKGISFGYDRDQLILDGAELSLESRERVALVGPSGSGKSTLAAILSGYLKPFTGTVTLDGEPLPHKGYCPVQLIYQHPEQAINPRWRLQRTLLEAWEPDEATLKGMGIEPAWLTRYPAELSGGEIQRFCIARALGPQTQFIIADEMTTMLDVITQAQIWELVLDAAERNGFGLLVVTHSLELAEAVCERVVHFEDVNAICEVLDCQPGDILEFQRAE